MRVTRGVAMAAQRSARAIGRLGVWLGLTLNKTFLVNILQAIPQCDNSFLILISRPVVDLTLVWKRLSRDPYQYPGCTSLSG